ncbi:ABC transporter permease/substrate-binding protein [Flammeovirgaceae bacterium SG7u.111]|nr:ABC transporter permease/substrate-binding protein [Flammeovirgaceae bacterium SG7u.132]WPO37499.1 ABC transporter permease/substrate-binding protein [Flammeovirgaceae bacterium SG7u.111]
MNEFLDYLQANQHTLWKETLQHIWLTLFSLFLATLVGVGLGILLTRFQKISRPVMGVVSTIQTIPSLALLGFLLPFLGIGVLPSIVMLFLYALLPIVRNTLTGIEGVDSSVKEAAMGMGFTSQQLLLKVELPLAMPTIFAGIRTASVINVGIATLCALIASGGLGTFIYRGISLNDANMILAGAIPATILALVFDFLFSIIQRNISQLFKPVLIVAPLVLLLVWFAGKNDAGGNGFTGGFHPEFMERVDGYAGMSQVYGLKMETVELDVGLMYQALVEGQVDVIGGYSTDGRIDAYGLKVLADDQNYFPPYQAVPVVRKETLEKYPYLLPLLDKLEGLIDNKAMRKLNYQVDHGIADAKTAAKNFLGEKGFQTDIDRQGDTDLAIGGKIFTEQFILGELVATYLENQTSLTVEVKGGLGGTKIILDALKAGQIDMYVEYTGTGFLVWFKPEEAVIENLIRSSEKVLDYVSLQSDSLLNIHWGKPLGFNNSYALMMRGNTADSLGIETMSDLGKYLGGE